MLPVATGALTAWYLYPGSPSVAPDPPSASDGMDEMWVSEPHRNNTAAATAAHTALVTAMLTRPRAWLRLSLCPHWHWRTAGADDFHTVRWANSFCACTDESTVGTQASGAMDSFLGKARDPGAEAGAPATAANLGKRRAASAASTPWVEK
jgi:hypothetical protein